MTLIRFPRTRSNSSSQPAQIFAPRRTLLALEPRTLYDGAAAVVADKVAGQQHHTAHAEQEGHVDHAQARSIAEPGRDAQPHEQVHTNELLFVDTTVSGWQSIVAQAKPNVQVILLDPARDPIDQIAQTMSHEGKVDAIHIVSHGADGTLQIGGRSIDLTSLQGYSTQLATIGEHLTSDGDILLYGCDIGEGAAGEQFVQALARATGADVAASTDATGAADMGGNWVLEYQFGQIDATVVQATAFAGLLEAPSVTGTMKDSTVVEPSVLNQNGPADSQLALTGWAIADNSVGTGQTDQVTVQVTLSNTAAGTLSDAGGHGTALGNGYTFTGTAADATAWVNQLKFSAADTELGNTAATTGLTVTVTDADTSVSSAKTIQLTVTPSNDPTVFSTGAGDGHQDVGEVGSTTITGLTGASSDSAALHIIDPEVSKGTQNASQIVYRLTDAPDYGYLTLNGARLGVGSIFTQADVLGNKLAYVHTASGADQNTADAFTVSVNDGATPQADSATKTVTLNVTPVNQAPVIVGSGGSVFEGQPRNAQDGGTPATLLSVVGDFIEANGGGDPGDAVLQVTITALTTHGTLHYTGQATIGGTTQTIDRDLTQADIDSGFVIDYAARSGLTYANDGIDVAGLPPNDSFGIRVTDGGGGAGVSAVKSVDGTVNITVRPVDDDPTFVNASTREATVDANGADHVAGTADDYRVTLTPDMLQAQDVDSTDAQLTFVVTQVPGSGLLLLNDGILQAGATFTMADVRAGRVQYLQTAERTDASPTDTFLFQVQDNALALHWNADGTSYTRPGGVYDAAGADAALTTFAFNVNLVQSETPDYTGPANPDHSSTPAPSTTVTTEHAGDDPNPGGVPIGTLIEGGSITLWGDDGGSNPIMLNYTADGIPPTQVVYTVEGFASGWSGQLLKNGVAMSVYSTFTQDDLNNGRITYQHDGSEHFESTVTLRVAAGGAQSDAALSTNDINFTFYITPVNDAPDAHGSSDTVIPEGGTVAVTTGMLSFSDPDDADSGSPYEDGTFNGTLPANGADLNFAINNGAGGSDPLQFSIAALPQHGTLEYLKDGVWTAITSADLNSLLLDASLLTSSAGTTGLRYIHDSSESSSDSFKVYAVDNRGVHSADGTVGITITAVNDSPQIAKDPTQGDPSGTSPNAIGPDGDPDKGSVNEPLTVVEEGGFKQITSDMLLAYDPDSTSEQVQYRVTTAPASGRLAYSTDGINFTTIGVGASFSQKDVNDGHIYYINDGTEPASEGYPHSPDDSFKFTVADGDKEQTGNEFWIYVKPTNDAPVVTAPSGPIVIDGASPADNPVPGFSIHDVDLDSVLSGVETDFVQVTVRLLTQGGTAFTQGQYSDVTISYATGSGATVDGTHNGSADFLTLRGTQAQVNAALAGLAVTFGNDHDAIYQVQVIADDRVRDASGGLIDTDSGTSGVQPEANGGPLNQASPGPGEPTAIPATEHDWYSEAVAANDPNIGAQSVIIWASVINDPAVFTGPATKDVVEDQATFIGGDFVVSDAESAAFGTTVKVTLSVPNGTLIIGSGSGVVGSGSGTGTITLTGTAQAIQDLLNDPTNGLKYQSPTDGNHDYNGAGTDGDVTLTVKFDDASSAIGDDTGSGSQPNNPPDITVALTIKPVNDAPTVTAGSGVVILNGTGATAIDGISVSDKDIGGDGDSNPATGETDFIQVTVRLLQQTDGSWVPVASGDYTGVELDSSETGSGVTKDATYDGSGKALVIRGTLEQVNDYLAGLTLSMGGLANKDAAYRLEIIADDRLRIASGALDGSGGANGGENNNAAGGTEPVPTDVIDPYAAIPGDLAANVSSQTRDLFPTDVNDPAEIKVTDPSVNEGSGTYALSGIVITDSDALGGDLTVTISLPAGFTFASQGSGAVIDSSTSTSVTITGTLAEINAHVNSMTVQLPDVAGTAGRTDWNGSFEVTLVVNDGGNSGGRPASLPGDTNNPDANPGDFDYADGSSNVLVTTRVYTVTVAPVNDAPVVTGGSAVDFGSVDEGNTSVSSTVDALFASHFSDARDIVDNSGLGNGSNVGAGTSGDDFWGVAIVGYSPNAAQGVWQYSTDGTTWTDVGSRTTSTALVLDKTVQLRFVAANDFHGTPSALTVNLVETDTGSNNDSSTADPVSNTVVNLSGAGKRGGQSVYGSDAITLGIAVDNLNDSPVLTGSSTLDSVAEDTTGPDGATVSDLFGGQYSDTTDNQGAGGANIAGGTDASTSLGGVAIVGNTANSSTEGVWEYSINGGTSWQAVGTVSDGSALVLGTSDMLRFVPVENYTGTPPSLDVRVADTAQTHATNVSLDLSNDGAGNESTWSGQGVLTTNVAPRNDAPVLGGDVNSADPGTSTVIAVTENGDTSSGESVPATPLLVGSSISDLDLGSTHDAANADILDSSIFGAGSVTVKFTDGYVTGDILFVDPSILAANGATLDATSNGQAKDLTIHFGTTTTVAQVNAVLNALSYRSSSDNPTVNGDRTERNFSVVVNDGRNDQGSGKTAGANPDGSTTTGLDSNAITGQIVITATNDAPQPADDAASVKESGVKDGGNVAESGTGSATGNVLTNDVDVDLPPAESLQVSQVNGSSANVGMEIDTTYGKITINQDGSYTYTLDNTKAATQALSQGQTVQDTFTYYVVDDKGLESASAATLTITITGTNDRPTITSDAAQAQGSVIEAGIDSNGDAVADVDTATGTLASNDVDTGASATWSIDTDSTPATRTGTYGDLVIDAATGKWTYTLDNSRAATQALKAGDSVTDTFTARVTDEHGAYSEQDITITVTGTNDAPVAVDDTNSTDEDTSITVSDRAHGVLPNDTDVDTPNTSLVVSEVNGSMGNVGTAIAGSNGGTFTLNADGTYTFDPGKDFQPLKNGESATTSIAYTVSDGLGGTDTATLTITVTGKDDTLGIAITDVDGAASGGQNSVTEKTGDTVTGTATITATAGVKTVTVSGVDISGATSLTPVEIGTTGNGTLVVTNYDAATGVITYEYTEADTAHSHNAANDNISDSFEIKVTDYANQTSSSDLNIYVLDTVPVAHADTNTVTEGTSTDPGVPTASGNVITTGAGADTLGADATTVVGVAKGDTGADLTDGTGVAGTGVSGNYGQLTLNADGSYSYSLENDNPAVNALKDGEHLTEVFTYTIQDADGDSSSTTLTITINGKTDGAPTVAPVDGNGTDSGQVTVYESGLTGDGPTGESKSADGTINLTAPDGLQSITVGTTVVTVAQLNDLGAHPVVITSTGKGTLTLTGFTSGGGDADAPTSGTLSYTYTLTDAQTGASSDGPSETTDSFALAVTDGTSTHAQATDTLTIRIVDDAPTANADGNTVTEDASTPVTGNVISGADSTLMGSADRVGADGATVTGAQAGALTGGATHVADGGVNAVGVDSTTLAGSYGTLVLHADGSYSYTLDNSNLDVQHLTASEHLTETYTYTLTDGDGDQSTTTLTITINGADDGVTVTVPDNHPTTPVTSDKTDQVVFERGLSDGSAPNADDLSVVSSFTVKALDGVDGTQAVTIGYTDGSGAQTLTLSQSDLEGLSTTAKTITTQYGTLVLDGYSQAADGTITVNYTYTLTTAPSVDSTDTMDSFLIQAKDRDGDVGAGTDASRTLNIQIVDDAPTAVADVNDVTEDAGTPITGNVISGTGSPLAGTDTLGADGATVTGAQAGALTGGATHVADGGVNAVGVDSTTLAGSYGTLVLHADGSYSYTLDNANTTVNALKDGETLTETYTYTLTDGDGDQSTTTLTITINGHTDGAPTITPDDGNGTADGHVTVREAGLADHDDSQTNTGTIAVDVPDGLVSIDVGGTTISLADLRGLDPADPATFVTVTTPQGEITLTGFDVTATVGGVPTEGTLTYSYTLTHVQNTPGDDSNTETIALGITDAGASTSSSTLTINIVDDVPTAVADVNSVTEDSGIAATGNVFANDRIGADGTATPGPVTDVAHGATSGTVGSALAGDYGTLTLNTDGSYSYVLDNSNPAVNRLAAGETLTETFSYTVTDGDGDTSTTTLTLTIRGANDAPVTVGTLPDVSQNDSTVVKVPTASGFTDVDASNTLTYTATGLPPGLSIDKTTGEIIGTLTHDASQGGDHGLYHIVVTATDNDGAPVSQTFTFQVLNPPPEAHPDTGAVDADSTLSVGGASGTIHGAPGRDIDVDGDPLTVIGVRTGTASDVPSVGTANVGTALVGQYGTLTLNADGSYTYAADQPGAKALKAHETAVDVFSYAISDGNGGVSYTTLNISVTGIVRALPQPPAPPDFRPIIDASQRPSSRSDSLITDPPHIWEDAYHENRVTNLSMPMHPIVYVEVAVQASQNQRDVDDLAAEGVDLDLVLPIEAELSSWTRGLGQDETIYVRHAVERAERERLILQGRALGRDGRTSLSADNLLPNHGIFAGSKFLQWLAHPDHDRDTQHSGAHQAGGQGQGQDHADAGSRGASAFSEQLQRMSRYVSTDQDSRHSAQPAHPFMQVAKSNPSIITE